MPPRSKKTATPKQNTPTVHAVKTYMLRTCAAHYQMGAEG